SAPVWSSVIETSSLTVRATLGPSMSSATAGTDPLNPTSAAVTPDGRELWVSQVDNLSRDSPGQLTVYSTAFGTIVGTVDVGGRPFFLALSTDGTVAYVADKESCDLREISVASLTVASTVAWPTAHGCPFGIGAGAVDGTAYTVTGSDHTYDEAHAGNKLGIVDFPSGSVRILGPVGRDPVTVALSPDGATAYVVDADRADVLEVDTATGAVTKTVPLVLSGPAEPLRPAARR
ncbi:MAG: YncE family protein, partial [Acidimicrobiales bacterium]